MSLFLHVGQCGNQVALPLWKLAESELSVTSGNCPLFDEDDGFARTIFIDSEPKVVTRTCCMLRRIRPSNVVLESSGCGNNWSMGFSSCIDEESESNRLFTNSINAIRKESERFDSMRSIVFVHSIGGGTGSGMGSALLQHVRDHFASSWVVPIVVGPFSRGDNPLQSYNSLFSLQYLNEFSDAVVYTDNDILSTTVGGRLGFEAMNQEFAFDIAANFFPLKERTSQWSSTSFGSILSTLCPLQRLRFLRIGSAHHAQRQGPSAHWEDLTRLASDRLGLERGAKESVAFASHVVARGEGHQDAEDIRRLLSKTPRLQKTAQWHPQPVRVSSTPLSFPNSTRTVGLAVNSSEMAAVLRRLSRSAAVKFHSKAYLHCYRRYGITEVDFAEAFESLTNIVSDYEEMSRISDQTPTD